MAGPARPDVVVITGDLTEGGLDAEYRNLDHLLRKHLPMPVFVIPGNHDRRDNLREGLKHLPGVIADPHYVQYAVDDHPVRLIMLDTLVPGANHGELRPEQLDYLDRTLAMVPDKPKIVGMHHPPFACGIAHMDRINLRTRRHSRRSSPHGRSKGSSAATTGRSWGGFANHCVYRALGGIRSDDTVERSGAPSCSSRRLQLSTLDQFRRHRVAYRLVDDYPAWNFGYPGSQTLGSHIWCRSRGVASGAASYPRPQRARCSRHNGGPAIG